MVTSQSSIMAASGSASAPVPPPKSTIWRRRPAPEEPPSSARSCRARFTKLEIWAALRTTRAAGTPAAEGWAAAGSACHGSSPPAGEATNDGRGAAPSASASSAHSNGLRPAPDRAVPPGCALASSAGSSGRLWRGSGGAEEEDPGSLMGSGRRLFVVLRMAIERVERHRLPLRGGEIK